MQGRAIVNVQVEESLSGRGVYSRAEGRSRSIGKVISPAAVLRFASGSENSAAHHLYPGISYTLSVTEDCTCSFFIKWPV